MGLAKKLASETAAYSVSSILARFINYLFGLFIIRYICAEEYGVYSKLYAYAGFLLVFLTHGMETTFFTLNHEQKLGEDTKVFLNGGYGYNNGYDYLVTASSRFNVIDNAGNYTSKIQNEPYCVKNGYFQLGVKQNWTVGDVKNEFALSNSSL